MNIQSTTIKTTPPVQPLADIRPKVVTPTDLKKTEVVNNITTTDAPVNNEQLTSAVKKVQQYIEPFNSNIEFSVNKDTDQIVIKVIDKQTQEVIKQIPSEEMIEMAKALDKIKGILVKQTA